MFLVERSVKITKAKTGNKNLICCNKTVILFFVKRMYSKTLFIMIEESNESVKNAIKCIERPNA